MYRPQVFGDSQDDGSGLSEVSESLRYVDEVIRLILDHYRDPNEFSALASKLVAILESTSPVILTKDAPFFDILSLAFEYEDSIVLPEIFRSMLSNRLSGYLL